MIDYFSDRVVVTTRVGNLLAGDVNGDGQFDFDDINPSIALLQGGSAAVPEPTNLALLGVGAGAAAPALCNLNWMVKRRQIDTLICLPVLIGTQF